MNYGAPKVGTLTTTVLETTFQNTNQAKLITVWVYGSTGVTGTVEIKAAAVNQPSRYVTIGTVSYSGAETGEELISTINIDSSVNPFIKAVGTLTAGESEVYIAFN